MDLPEVPVLTGIAAWLARLDTFTETPTYRVDEGLSVEIREHAVATAHGPRPATSFVTRGLCDHRQPELVFTWCGPRLLGTPTAAAIAGLRTVGRAIVQGLELRPGSAYALGDGALLESVGLAGFMFVPAQAMPGLSPPKGALHAVGVTAGELDLVAKTTVHRLASRLGEIYGVFPWPVWSAPRRSAGSGREETALAAFPRAIVPGLVVALDGTALSITVPRASTLALIAAIRDPAAVYAHGVAIGAEPDASADGQLVWCDDDKETIAVSAPKARGRRTSGAFLHVAAGDCVRGTVLEDGFTLALDPDSRDALCAALEAGLSWNERAEAGEVQVTIV
jgi:hypothetical protein